MKDYIMMNKLRTSLMAAVLVGTTMLFTPVQAGVFNKLGKVVSKGFKVVRMAAETIITLGGVTAAGFIYTLDSPEKIRQLICREELPNALSRLRGWLYGQIGKDDIANRLFTYGRVPAISLASSLAILGFVSLLHEFKGNNNNKSEIHDEKHS